MSSGGAFNDWRDRELAAARARIDTLEQEVRQLKEVLVPKLIFPLHWRLSAAEDRILASLYAARGHPRSREALRLAYKSIGADDGPGLKAVDVHVYWLRRKLAAYGIAIVSRWGFGYLLPPESISAIKASYREAA